MLFTKECDYAIRIMRALSSGELISVSRICEMEHLPSAMTYKITRKLEKSGFLKSCRGTNGGYALNLKLADISLCGVEPLQDVGGAGAQCAAFRRSGYPSFRMYERGLSLFYEQSEKSMSGTSRILPAAEYAGTGNETKISCRIISVSVFLP